MNDLQSSIETITSLLPSIPVSQNFWLNRTNDGEFYELFLDKKIVGLDIDELKLSEIDLIRKANLRPNGRPIYDKIQQEIQILVKEKHKKEIRETPVQKRSALLARLTMRANQIFNFAFKIKKGDFVVIPSKNSTYISIGRIKESFLDNNSDFTLQRKIVWEKTYSKISLDPNFYRLFFTQQALTDINKYKDIVLRTLYDFYFDDEFGHLVFNISTNEKINALDESAFTFKFLTLLNDFIDEYGLTYDINEINTIINLNSPGKKKFFGPKSIIFLSAIMVVMTVGGGIEQEKWGFSMKTKGIIQSISDYLNDDKRREISDEIVQRSDSLSIEQQEIFLKLIKELDSEE